MIYEFNNDETNATLSAPHSAVRPLFDLMIDLPSSTRVPALRIHPEPELNRLLELITYRLRREPWTSATLALLQAFHQDVEAALRSSQEIETSSDIRRAEIHYFDAARSAAESRESPRLPPDYDDPASELCPADNAAHVASDDTWLFASRTTRTPSGWPFTSDDSLSLVPNPIEPHARLPLVSNTRPPRAAQYAGPLELSDGTQDEDVAEEPDRPMSLGTNVDISLAATDYLLRRAQQREAQIRRETSRLLALQAELDNAQIDQLQQRQQLWREMSELRRRGSDNSPTVAHYSIDEWSAILAVAPWEE
ncbi:hypothetical protein J1614_007196 [Plenodomus biglobosus]|nr:hypothetical protein J1614_007196 [Plenodomus biglobosus]